MPLSEKSSLQVEITDTDLVQIRLARIIMDGDEEVSRTYTRTVLAPGEDYSGMTGKIRRAAQAAHVPTVVDRHQKLEAQQLAQAEHMLRQSERVADDTPETQAAEQAAEQVMLEAEAAYEAAEAAHEAFLAAEDE